MSEIGGLRFKERMSLASIRNTLKQNYGLDIDVRRLADWSLLYEAACLAWWNKHPKKIREALDKLEERIYLLDYTEDTTKQPVFRVFVAGITLGLITRVVEKPKADAIQPLLYELNTLYGTPDLVVCDDDDTIKKACTNVWPEVPIQTCFEHLLRNITKTFLQIPHRQAASVLQRAAYRKTLENLMIELKKNQPEPWPAHGEDIREIIELLLYNPPGGDHTSPSALQKLRLFEEVWTHLNYLLKAISGQKLPKRMMMPELQTLHEYKESLPECQKFQGTMDPRLLKDPFYAALIQVKKVVDAVHNDKKTRRVLQSWHSGRQAINRLRSFHWALKIHQLKKHITDQPEGASIDQKRALDRLQKKLNQQLSHHKREVRALTTEASNVPPLAAVQLQKLIKSWEHQKLKDLRFGTAANQLRAAAPDLLHFITFKTAPASQQELEGQNNRLKQVFRQQSGHVHTRYRFVYHAEGTSAVLNFHSKNEEKSPLERLGIEFEPASRWLLDLDWTDLQQAKRYLLDLRRPRRGYLKVKKKGLGELRRETLQEWVTLALKLLQTY
jgi:hypothetical protein